MQYDSQLSSVLRRCLMKVSAEAFCEIVGIMESAGECDFRDGAVGFEQEMTRSIQPE